jgi:hypothetical protein
MTTLATPAQSRSMNPKLFVKWALTTVVSVILPATALAQGVLNFDSPWVNNGLGYFSLRSYSGFSLTIANPPPRDAMSIVGALGPSNFPHNGTPYLAFSDTLGLPQLTRLAYTNAADLGHSFVDGSLFDLLSVDLADPLAPSLSPISIVFNGFRADGSAVSQTFVVGGGGSSSFTTFQFNSSFSDLVRVEIPSPAWAMDNLVYYIPEPCSTSLLLIGLACLLGRRGTK